MEACERLSTELKGQSVFDSAIRVEVDDRDLRVEKKYWQWVKKGVPLTVEIGPRDLENGTVFVGRRDLGGKREGMQGDEFFASVGNLLSAIQKNLFDQAAAFQKEHTKDIDSKDSFTNFYPQVIHPSRKFTVALPGFIGIDKSNGKSN